MLNPPRAKPCPVCRKKPSDDHAPFCSRGCKDRDLLKWLGEGYRIPGPPADEQGQPLGGVDSEEGQG
ncbi:MAG: DNA gyrase inhibitor YacG [Pseudomonadota bacterium]|nr:DNA gyrase inhibitor YacG [Pseudomonadota bacterium]